MTAQRSAQGARKAGASQPPRGTGDARAEQARGARPERAVAEPAAQPGAFDRASELAAAWGPTVGRLLLGAVLAWFGYHELVRPALWTGYVPGVHAATTVPVLLVLAHGWVLLLLSVALLAGVAYRLAAAVAAVLLLQIVVWLSISAGFSDLTLRDVGVLGLALCVLGSANQRLVLTG